MEKITSLQNPRIKNLVRLQKQSERTQQGLFVVEGYKEIQLAIKAGYISDSLFYFPMPGVTIENLFNQFQSFEISKAVFEKLAYREGSDGLIATFNIKKNTLNGLALSNNPLILIVESVEKPGNLGAILRTADAAKIDAVIVCDARTDIYNPNVVRSSVGCIFTNQVVCCTNQQALDWLNSRHIQILAAALAPNALPYYKADYSKPSAIVLGTEANGLSDFWLKNCHQKIIIPMQGMNDSLNVSVSAAVITFEAKRQRNFL